MNDGEHVFTKPIRFKTIIKTAKRLMTCGRCSGPIHPGEQYGFFYAALSYCLKCLENEK